VNARGQEMMSMLKATKSQYPDMIYDVRGLGLMQAVEFVAGKGLASKVQAKCMEKDMLILTTSIYDTLRFIPPLNISKEDMSKGLGILEEAIREVAEGAKS